MEKLEKLALQTAKEIVVKFIEVGRVSPTNFNEIFPAIYDQILMAIDKDAPRPQPEKNAGSKADT